MENDILDSLEDLGYAGPLLKEGALQECVQGGPRSPEFTKLIEWLTKELQVLLQLEEQVNAITDPNDSSSFLLELSGFLKEIGCPHKILTEGPTNQKLQTPDSCFTLLGYLCTELQAARMLEIRKSASKMKVEMKESETGACLREMLTALSISKPPATITSADLFSKVETKVQSVLQQQQKGSGDATVVVGKPLFSGVLTSKQWDSLSGLQQQMHKEYTIRRDLLLKRLDVTIQSFKWGDRLKKKTNEIAKEYEPRRRGIAAEPDVQVAHVLAAREDLAIIEKTSSARVLQNMQCDVKKVRIGKVPDRGGRPEDQRPPPPEMPSWQKRTEGPRGGGGGGGGGRGGSASGGNRVQGGSWSNQQGGNFQGGWDKQPPQNNYQPQQQPLNYQQNFQQANYYQAPQGFQHAPYQPNQQQSYQQQASQQYYQQPHQQSYEQAYQQPQHYSDNRGRSGGQRGRGQRGGPRGGRGAQHTYQQPGYY